MNNELLIKLITASVSPAVMISGTAMLVLAFLGRQGILAGRLRELHERALEHAERFHQTGASLSAERAALALQQAKAIYARARLVKWTLVFLFTAIVAFVLCSMGLGAGVFFAGAVEIAVVLFVAGMLCLFVAALLAIGGALKSMTPLRHEQAETEKLLERIGKITAKPMAD